jgi:hypothetical protein
MNVVRQQQGLRSTLIFGRKARHPGVDEALESSPADKLEQRR